MTQLLAVFKTNFSQICTVVLKFELYSSECCVFRLGYFERRYYFYNKSQLTSEITRHYSSQVSVTHNFLR